MPVYIIQPGDYPVVKIGVSVDVKRRLAWFASAHWVDFKIIHTIEGGVGEERWLHRRFAERLIRGEWFNFDPAMLTVEIPPDEVRQLSLSPSQRRAVAMEAIRAGRSYSDIGEELGITRERVRQYANAMGIRAQTSFAKSRERQLFREEQNRIRKQERAVAKAAQQERFRGLVAQGYSFSKAAKTLGFNAGLGHRWAIELNLSAKHSRWQADLPERRALAVRLVREGSTQADAARATGLCTPTVAKALRAAEDIAA